MKNSVKRCDVVLVWYNTSTADVQHNVRYNTCTADV